MARKKTMTDLTSYVDRVVRRGEAIVQDVADNCGQILENVQHTTWFKQAVAEEIMSTDDRYTHLSSQA